MDRLYSFATGNIWRWNDDPNRNALLDPIRSLDISGVELTFSSKEELYAFRPSKINREWLKSLDYVTIHAPFTLLAGGFDETELMRQLECLSVLYHQIDAKNVVIHPERPVFDGNYLDRCDFQISTENLPRGFGISSDDLMVYLERFPRMMLCLDVAHAYFWGKRETGRLIERFGDRISQIHFSGTYRQQDHLSLQIVSRDFLRSICPLKTLPVPIVIEEDMDVSPMSYIINEINYIKQWFGDLA